MGCNEKTLFHQNPEKQFLVKCRNMLNELISPKIFIVFIIIFRDVERSKIDEPF